MAEEIKLEEQKVFHNALDDIDPADCIAGDTYKPTPGVAMAAYQPFAIRTTKPTKADKYYQCYIRDKNEAGVSGWSGAVKGKPMDTECNVLSNCVGYAQGRFCEIIDMINGTTGNKYKYLNCDASGFMNRAKGTYPDLKMGSTPRIGAILCWGGGGGGCGHVAVVERVNPDGSIFTSESSWGGTAFRNNTRTNSNGRWGMGSSYNFQTFIYNPAVKAIEPTPTVERDEYKNQVICHENALRIRTAPNLQGEIIAHAVKDGLYNWYETSEADGYTWYKIDESGQWFADDHWLEVLPRQWHTRKIEVKNTETVTIETSLSEAKFGDEVQINVIPAKGYSIKNACVNGTLIIDNKFTMPDEDVVITAEVELTTFHITYKVEGCGTVKLSSSEAHYQEIIHVTAIPDENYLFDSITSNEVVILGEGFVMPDKDVELNIIFTEIVGPRFKVGDKVLIHRVGNTKPDGSGTTVFHVGEHQTISNILWDGTLRLEPFCYELSAWNGTKIGFYREEDLTIYHEETLDSDLKVGDTVKIRLKGNSKPDGTGYTTYGLSWKREIMEIVKGALYPYKVGKNGVVQGYYNATGLTKIK